MSINNIIIQPTLNLLENLGKEIINSFGFKTKVSYLPKLDDQIKELVGAGILWDLTVAAEERTISDEQAREFSQILKGKEVLYDDPNIFFSLGYWMKTHKPQDGENAKRLFLFAEGVSESDQAIVRRRVNQLAENSVAFVESKEIDDGIPCLLMPGIKILPHPVTKKADSILERLRADCLPAVPEGVRELIDTGLIRDLTEETIEGPKVESEFYAKAATAAQKFRSKVKLIPHDLKGLENSVAYFLKTVPLEENQIAKRLFRISDGVKESDKMLLRKRIFTLMEESSVLVEAVNAVQIGALESGRYLLYAEQQKMTTASTKLSDKAEAIFGKLREDYLPRKNFGLLYPEKIGLILDITEQVKTMPVSAKIEEGLFDGFRDITATSMAVFSPHNTEDALNDVKKLAYHMMAERPKKGLVARRIFRIHPSVSEEERLLLEHSIHFVYGKLAGFLKFSQLTPEALKNETTYTACVVLPKKFENEIFKMNPITEEGRSVLQYLKNTPPDQGTLKVLLHRAPNKSNSTETKKER